MDEHDTTVEGIRVVLAEDHALVREGTRRILDEGGITVVAEVADGKAAVAAVDEHRPDVVLMDIGMPVMNGIEATRQIKAEHPKVSVLVLTMHDDEQYILALLQAGAAGYLLKDIEGHQLVQAVEAVHAGESVLHPSVTRTVLARLASGRPLPSSASAAELSEREHEVLRLAARGLANKQIAAALGLSARTVQSHLGKIFHKLEVGSRTEAVLEGLRRGWFDLDELDADP